MLLTHGACDPLGSRGSSHPALAGTALSGVWGIARVLRMECSALRTVIADVSAGGRGVASAHAELCSTALAPGAEVELLWRRAKWHVARLRRSAPASTRSPPRPLDPGVFVITGALGGLGLRAAQLLAESGATALVLMSRRGIVARDGQGLGSALARVLATAPAVRIVAGDASLLGDSRCVQRVASALKGPVGGVLHAAGLLRDRLLPNVSQRDLRTVLAPKAVGGWHLHRATLQQAPAFLVYFSSIAAAFGSVGQLAYAAANAYMDGLSVCRRACGLSARSLQLPLVDKIGMGAATFSSERLESIERIDPSDFAACLALAVASPSPLCCALPWDVLRLARSVPDPDAPLQTELLSGVSSSELRGATPVVLPGGAALIGDVAAQREAALSMVVAVAQELVRLPALKPDVPLMEAGMDSIGAAELASELHARLGMRFHATVIFEFPTARAIAEHVLERASPSWDREPRRKPAATPSADGDAARHPVALRGLASRWPAACESSAQLRAVLRSGGDAVGTVPARRWMASDDAVPHPPAARHGSFVREAERFDCAFFGLSPAESAAMDPQQRLLLEVGYAALHNAGHRRAPLLGSDTGVFLGIQNTDWLQGAAGAAASSVYAVSGGTISIAAGRLSFALGLHGPCASVDTACSSALVALHGARQALRAAECGDALCAAISLTLLPGPTLACAAAGMLSPAGRCKTFDAAADGYVRAEGCGAVALRGGAGSGGGGTAAVTAAAAPRLPGSAVRQDGRSASLTAPNGAAQKVLLGTALRDAGGAAVDRGVLEAHGTGTTLGDPTEARAVAEELGLAAAVRGASIAVGGVKANFGHMEPAAGMVGMHKALLQLYGRETHPNAQLRRLNPFVAESTGMAPGALVLPAHAQRREAASAAVGVSSFGYSGTLAHAIVAVAREAPPSAALTQAAVAVQPESAVVAAAARAAAATAAAAGGEGATAAAAPAAVASPAAVVPRGLAYTRRHFGWRPTAARNGVGFYAVRWERRGSAVSGSPPPPRARDGCVCLCAAPGRVGAAMQRALVGFAPTTTTTITASELRRLPGAAAGCRALVWVAARSALGSPDPAQLTLVVRLSRWLVGSRRPPALLILTPDAMGRGSATATAPLSCLWAMLRVLRLEQPRLRATCANAVGNLGPAAARSLAAELHVAAAVADAAPEPEVSWRANARHVPRLRGVCETSRRSAPLLQLPPQAGCFVTGGLGGLGLVGAGLLVRLGAAGLVLTSRRGQVAPENSVRLRALQRAVRVRAFACDAGEPTELRGALRASHGAGDVLCGVLHAAGVADKGLVQQLALTRVLDVARPKARGAWALHKVAAMEALDFSVGFSSVAAALGNPGQAAYAMANAYLDGLAAGSAAAGLPACSLQLPLVAGVGMGAAALSARQMAFRGMATARLDQYVAGLATVIACAPSGHVPLVLLPWARRRLLACVSDEAAPVLEALTHEVVSAERKRTRGGRGDGSGAAVARGGAGGAGSAGGAGADPASALPAVQRLARDLLGVSAGEVAADVPLLEAGLDSLASTELASRLSAEYGVRLPPTAVTDFPTPRALAGRVRMLFRRQPRAAPSASSAGSAGGGGGAGPALLHLMHELPAAQPHLLDVVTLRAASGGGGTPIFFLHSLHGKCTPFAGLAARHVGEGALRGLEHAYLRTGSERDARPASLRQLAARHACLVAAAADGRRRVHLIGESFGGALAASVSAAAAALGARPRLLSMLEPTPPRAAWRATPAAGAARRDPALFLQLAGVGAGPRDDAAAWAALSAPEELALVVAALVGRGLVASTPAHVRRVERLLEVLRTSQSALGRQRPHAAPPARPHPAGALVAHASRRRRFFEHGGVALVCHAPPGHTAVYARPTRAITLEGAHLRAIARALAERGGRFGAAVAAAALATECGDQEARVVET